MRLACRLGPHRRRRIIRRSPLTDGQAPKAAALSAAAVCVAVTGVHPRHECIPQGSLLWVVSERCRSLGAQSPFPVYVRVDVVPLALHVRDSLHDNQVGLGHVAHVKSSWKPWCRLSKQWHRFRRDAFAEVASCVVVYACARGVLAEEAERGLFHTAGTAVVLCVLGNGQGENRTEST